MSAPEPVRVVGRVEAHRSLPWRRGGRSRWTATLDRASIAVNGNEVGDAVLVAYLADVGDSRRPTLFCWNGGPGASSGILHLGDFGPWVAERDGGWTANPDCLLDVADLVFVDPPGTGVTTPIVSVAAKAALFGVLADARVLAVVIGEWLQRHRRRDRDVVLVGESYGALRAASVALETETARRARLTGLIGLAVPSSAICGLSRQLGSGSRVATPLYPAGHMLICDAAVRRMLARNIRRHFGWQVASAVKRRVLCVA